MTCPQCRADNPPGHRFCEQCGAALEARCAQCGATLRAGARFCGACGQRVAEAPPAAAAPGPPAAPASATPVTPRTVYTPKHLADKILSARSAIEGERRTVTVLFADIAGFTTLAEARDPEEVHRIIDRCFEAITAEVHRFEGTINQYTGDGVMALFGAPIAHEDSARRAAHAALGIQRAIRDLSAELRARQGPDLKMRIGLNTGPVVVGRIGDDLRMDYTAVGDTTNLAARLQQAARPGSVLASEATERALGGVFETLDSGELAVKGRAPVHAFEIVRPRGRRSQLAVAAERGLTPLIGREREVATLVERYADVKAGRGQVIHLVGEAGIGKSRLALEFRRRLAEAGEQPTWLEGRCISFGQSMPLLPIIEQLRENFGIEEFDGEPEIIAKVEHGMRRLGGLEPHIPFIRSVLSVDPGDPAVAALEPEARRRKVFESVRALAARGAARRPIVFVIEDLHWIDRTSEEYLGQLVDSLAALPIMLILTFRVGYSPPFGTRSYQTTLSLRALSEAEMLSMAARVLGTDAFPAELKTALMDKAEGVPLFIEEVSKTLLDLGVLRREDGGLRLVKALADVSVPDTIQGIIMARLDRLGDNGKRTVQLASVIGRQFLVRLLERVAGFTGELDGLLRELKALEIVYEQGLLPEPAYIFKHAVIQDVAYNSLLKERRRDLHRTVGLAIEDLYPERLAEHAEELAHHFGQGEEWSKAFEYLIRSGDKARYAYATQAAIDFYTAALAAAAHLPEAASRAAALNAHHRRGQMYLNGARFLEAADDFEAMRALAAALGDRAAEGQALADKAFAYFSTFRSEFAAEARRCAEEAQAVARAIGNDEVLAAALMHLGSFEQAAGQLADADRLFAESLSLSEARGLTQLAAQTRGYLGAHANWQGRLREAIDTCRQAERDAAEHHHSLQELYAIAFRCLAEIGLGEFATAQATIADAMAKTRERGNAFIEGRLTNTLGWLHQELGDFGQALDLDQRSVDIGRRITNPNVEISAVINVGLDRHELGERGAALTLLEDAATRVDKFAFGAHRWRWSIHVATYLAEVLLASGDSAAALGQADKALALARATGSLKYVGRAHGLLGHVALAEGAAGRAVTEAGEALRAAREIGHPTSIWQAAHLLARAQAAAGAHEAAAGAARVTLDTLDAVAARAPEAALRQAFLGWRRVQAAREDSERILRA